MILEKSKFNIGFINIEGYTCPKVLDKPQGLFGWGVPKAIYQFDLDKKNPLTLHYIDGLYYRPNKHFLTDQGSVPRFAQTFIPKDRFLLSFLFHDSAYIDGGLWVCGTYDGEYKFVEMTRAEIDSMLYHMIRLEPCPGGCVSSSVVWIGVRLGGAFYWTDDKVRPDPLVDIPSKDQPTAYPKSACILHG